MPVTKPIQTSFNMGVLSPEMMARTDIEQYYRGAKTIKNGVVLPQGGITKRNGFKYLAALDIKSTSAYFNNAGGLVRVLPYLSNEETFLVVISATGMLSVMTERGSIVQVSEPSVSTAADSIDISHRLFGDAIEDAQYKQITNDLVILTEYSTPFVLIKKSPELFEIKDIPNLKVPKSEYLDKFDAGTSRWEQVLITFEGVENGDAFSIGISTAAGTPTNATDFIYSVTAEPLDGSTTNAGDNADAMATNLGTALGATAKAVYEVTPRQVIKESDGSLVNVNLRTFAGIELTRTTAIKHDPMFCVSKARHESRIKCKPIKQPKTLSATEELPSWDVNRGFPSVAGEFGGRFVLAGTSDQPETIWMSRIYQYYDFTPDATPVATSPIEVTLATEKASRITGIIDSRRLTIFTNKTAYILGGAGEDVITPDTVRAQNIRIQGSKRIRPESLDDVICYVQQSGAELNSTSYEFASDSYITSQSSIYSAHLLKDVRQMSKTISDQQFNAEYLTCLNIDGTMANYSSLKEQELRNWTEFTTQGEVVDLVGVRANNFALIRRGIDGKEIITLEKMTTEASYCDQAQDYFSSVPFDKIGGFQHLTGETLVAIADGYDFDLIVDSNGYVTFPFKASKATVGLPFDFEVEPMPVNVEFQSGSIVNTRKRINQVRVSALNSRDVTLEYAGRDYAIADRHVGFKLGEPPQPYTGVKTLRLTGWINQGSVKIKSNRPVGVTVLGLEMKVRAKG
ncbi:head-closure protein [Vibrio phage 1.254.O._10N.286.45.C8]|nr:head-closure protein [Vibrio phage 1.254.O._10N.286.45.C8]